MLLSVLNTLLSLCTLASTLLFFHTALYVTRVSSSFATSSLFASIDSDVNNNVAYLKYFVICDTPGFSMVYAVHVHVLRTYRTNTLYITEAPFVQLTNVGWLGLTSIIF